jgi:hypothetical protein
MDSRLDETIPGCLKIIPIHLTRARLPQRRGDFLYDRTIMESSRTPLEANMKRSLLDQNHRWYLWLGVGRSYTVYIGSQSSLQEMKVYFASVMKTVDEFDSRRLTQRY